MYRRHPHLARAIYRLGKLLTRVKTPRRVYKWNIGAESLDDRFTPAGRRWLPCKTSVNLVVLSSKLDADHWDHWAFDHSKCVDGIICDVCGGHIDPQIEENDDDVEG